MKNKSDYGWSFDLFFCLILLFLFWLLLSFIYFICWVRWRNISIPWYLGYRRFGNSRWTLNLFWNLFNRLLSFYWSQLSFLNRLSLVSIFRDRLNFLNLRSLLFYWIIRIYWIRCCSTKFWLLFFLLNILISLLIFKFLTRSWGYLFWVRIWIYWFFDIQGWHGLSVIFSVI